MSESGGHYLLDPQEQHELENVPGDSGKGMQFFSAVVDDQQRPNVRRLDYQSKQQLSVKRDGFKESPDSHYFPPWAKFWDPSKYCLNYV
jgi:hypothetical protein